MGSSPVIRVHRTSDGALVGVINVEGQRSIGWLDSTRLVVGSTTIGVWEIETRR
jgi:hypothetical protein